MAERVMVLLLVGLAGVACRSQHLNRAAIISSQIIKPRDVVVVLQDERGHAFLLAEGAALLVGPQSALEIIECDQTCGHIAQSGGSAFDVVARQELLVSAFVAGECFWEPVLTVIHVADVEFKAARAPTGISFRKEPSG